MKPSQKDIKGYYNFFDRKDFIEILDQIGFENYYIQWTNGKEKFI